MKKGFILLSMVTVLMLSGCASMETKFEQALLEQSGINENADYILYEEYRDAGKLDDEGQYIAENNTEDALSAQEKEDGQIRVTFAKNGYLEIWYYVDETMTTPIVADTSYMYPGDSLYAKVIDYHNDNSNQYRLAEFRIIEYDADGHISNQYRQEAEDGELEYEIPSDFKGSELSIVPVGKYLDRDISMKVFYKDDSGIERTLGNAGTWTINDDIVEGDNAQINPLEAYALKFTYDTDNFFYVGCEPESFSKDPGASGVVEFWEADATDDNLKYSVELHPYLKLSISFDKEAKVSVNRGDAEIIKKNKTWSSDKLRYGDSITIETAGVCTITDGSYRHISATKDPIADGYRYTLKVVQEAADNSAEELIPIVPVNRVFDVNLDTNGKYGIGTYKLDGKEVSGEVQLQEGQELTLTYKITDKKCSFADKSDGAGGFIRDLFKPKERTISIPITANLDGTTVSPDDWFNIVKKGEAGK